MLTYHIKCRDGLIYSRKVYIKTKTAKILTYRLTEYPKTIDV